MSRKYSVLLPLLIVLALLTGSAAAAKEPKLAPNYERFVNHDAFYFISKEERQAFFQLTTDAERDTFIQQFWDVRNPSPGAPGNEFKEEVLSRIAYANQMWGHPHGEDNGWKTDMGHVYVVLGAPKQKAQYYSLAQTKPFEIWFYENTYAALPPYFNILFYQKDIGDDYRIYSPYMDGPDKLTTSSMVIGNRKGAFDLIDKEAGREVARTTLSLVPGEPVDINSANSSLESDLMISKLRTIADNPLTKDQIRRNRDLLSSISHRIVIEGDYLEVLTSTLRDGNGTPSLHYVMRLQRPSDFSMGKSDKGFYYSAEVSIRAFDATKTGALANQPLLTHEQTLTKYLSDDEFGKAKGRTFGYSGVLPLPPGKYRLEFVFTDKLKQTALKTSKEVTVPAPPQQGVAISDLVPFSEISRGAAGASFSVSGVRFIPAIGEQLTFVPGQDLKVMYQLWAPAAPLAQNTGKKLQVEYGYGRPGIPGDAKSLKDDVTRDQFDRNGSMITGKRLPTADLPVGNYRLVVTVTDPETQRKTFAAMGFRLADSNAPLAFDLADENALKPGTLEFERGDVLTALGRPDEAAPWYEAALSKDPANEQVRSHLADIYFGKQDFQKVIALYTQVPVGAATEDQTVLHVAESFAKTGKPAEAIAVLESALKVKQPSEPLYLALADYYQASGNSAKAAEMKDKGRSLAK